MRVFIFSLFVCLFVLVSCQQSPQPITPLRGELPIDVPRVASVGQSIDVQIGPVPALNGTPIGLIAVGTQGPRVYNTVFNSGMARFMIPSTDTRQPGYMALIAAADDARGEASIIIAATSSSSASNPGYAEGLAGFSTPDEEAGQ